MQLILEISAEMHSQLVAFLEPSSLTRMELASIPAKIRQLRKKRFEWSPEELRKLNTITQEQGIRARYIYTERKLVEFEETRKAEIARLQKILTMSTIQGVAVRALHRGLLALDKEQS